MAYREPTYPPIFPPGFFEVTVEALEERFVASDFDTPLRRRLTAQVRLFVTGLARLGVHGEVWIDGSYATRKPDPRDVDVVLLVSIADVEAAPATDASTTLKHYMTREGRDYVRTRWHVDFYVVDANNPDECDYWEDLLSRNPDQHNRKGIPFVRI